MPAIGFFFAAATAAAALFTAIDANDRDSVEKLLAADPKLASAHDEKGVSAAENAAFIRSGSEGFMCTHENPVLKAILARAPTLDVFDAALVGDAKRVAELLTKDPKLVTARAKLGWTPLHFAAFGGNLEAVKLLFTKGADLEARAQTRFRNTALQIALLCGEAQVASYLLDRGADANVRQEKDFRPLHEAAFLGRVDLIELLLRHGAEVNPRSETGETPLRSALRKGRTAAAELLRARGGTE